MEVRKMEVGKKLIGSKLIRSKLLLLLLVHAGLSATPTSFG